MTLILSAVAPGSEALLQEAAAATGAGSELSNSVCASARSSAAPIRDSMPIARRKGRPPCRLVAGEARSILPRLSSDSASSYEAPA